VILEDLEPYQMGTIDLTFDVEQVARFIEKTVDAEEEQEEAPAVEEPTAVQPEMADPYAAYAGNDEPDYSAYYSREGAAQEEMAEPAFAAPVHLSYQGYEEEPWPQEDVQDDSATGSNVYRPRKATWADAERREVLSQSDLGYQVHQDDHPARKRKKKKRRHTVRNLLLALLILAALAAAAFVLYQPVMEWLKKEEILPVPTEEPFVPVVTPQPIRAYEAAPAAEMAPSARKAIRQLSGSLPIEDFIVTDSNIVTRSRRADGTYDFYLYAAPQGRLLAYFEGLGPQDMMVQEGGSFYVAQEPYLVSSSGSALIRTASLEASLDEEVFLHPMQHGWAVVESKEDGSANYISPSGQLISTLWFSRTFPFTGDYTLAYVDTGSTADADQRYLLYVLGTDGTMSRWLSTAHTEDVVAAVCGMAYMRSGDLYRLPDTSAALLNTRKVDAYLDCDALVVQDPRTGKYGLLVHGEQHYDFAYDSIRPVESDIVWAEKTLGGNGASLTVHAVSGAVYPQPLSHSFVLEKEGQREYVALSTASSCPIRLDGEF